MHCPRGRHRPLSVSLATKVLGAGEGGFVISADTALIRDIRARSNFGFAGTREAVAPAANAKLSEYHAAVAHATAPMVWGIVRSEWLACAGTYRRALRPLAAAELQPGFGRIVGRFQLRSEGTEQWHRACRTRTIGQTNREQGAGGATAHMLTRQR